MKLKNRILFSFFPLMVIMVLTGGCGIYSFRGATLSPDVKTFSVANIFNDSGNGPSNMSQTFQNRLKDYFQQNTNLGLVSGNGDLRFEGNIIGYTLTPSAPRASTNPREVTAELMRLTITVKVTYNNTIDPTYNFENKSFSFYQDFDAQKNLNEVENELIDGIFERIIEDIYNASVANW